MDLAVAFSSLAVFVVLINLLLGGMFFGLPLKAVAEGTHTLASSEQRRVNPPPFTCSYY